MSYLRGPYYFWTCDDEAGREWMHVWSVEDSLIATGQYDPMWKSSVKVPLEEFDTVVRRRAAELAAESGGCLCDPPGSGEEYCTGHCVLRARVTELENAIRRMGVVLSALRTVPYVEGNVDAHRLVADAINAGQAALFDPTEVR